MGAIHSPAASRRTTSYRTGLVVAATLLLGGVAACASSKPATEDTPRTSGAVVSGPEGRQNRLFEGITLSDAQRASIDSIRAAHRDRMGSAREGGDRAQLRQMMEEQRAAIRNVLTPEQQRTFDANVEQMRHDRGRRG